ncbi:hypothetical protein ACEXQD_06315 [Herbiconiux sp. P15]|uniref:hypothetical protein n=1 Tax=Herbiconiux liukaitaii TaxID=3342799 RepID=UPI0035B7ABA9
MNTLTSPRPTRQTRRRPTWRVTLLAAPALLLALTGCVAGGSSDAASSPGSTGGADQPITEAEFSAARDAYDRKLAECLRDQGLDVKDPQPGEGITEDSPEIRAAYPACAAEIGDPPSSAGIEISPEDLDKLLEQAECLRKAGYDIQEPTTTDPGFIPAEVSEEDFETCRVA